MTRRAICRTVISPTRTTTNWQGRSLRFWTVQNSRVFDGHHAALHHTFARCPVVDTVPRAISTVKSPSDAFIVGIFLRTPKARTLFIRSSIPQLELTV